MEKKMKNFITKSLALTAICFGATVSYSADKLLDCDDTGSQNGSIRSQYQPFGGGKDKKHHGGKKQHVVKDDDHSERKSPNHDLNPIIVPAIKPCEKENCAPIFCKDTAWSFKLVGTNAEFTNVEKGAGVLVVKTDSKENKLEVTSFKHECEDSSVKDACKVAKILGFTYTVESYNNSYIELLHQHHKLPSCGDCK